MLRRFLLASLLLVFSLQSEAATRAVIIDTDMGFDDWAAIVWLLNQNTVEVKAITVDCEGLARCPEAAYQAARLTRFMKQHIPIYLGAVSKQARNYYPKPLRDFSTELKFVQKEGYLGDIHLKTPAAKAIARIITKSKSQPIEILSIGSAKNIADAYQSVHQQPEEAGFRRHLKRIYKEGGAFSKALIGGKSSLSNHAILGNLNIPFLFATDNTTAEWNIFSDPEAMQVLLNAHLPITFLSINASLKAPMRKVVVGKLYGLHSKMGDFVANATNHLVKAQGGWANIAKNLDFWDTSAAIMMMHPDIITKQYFQQPVCINLNESKPMVTKEGSNQYYSFEPTDYSYYGTVILDIAEPGDKKACYYLQQHASMVDIVMDIDPRKFQHYFYQGFKKLG